MIADPIADLVDQAPEQRRQRDRRVWAAIIAARTVDVAESILRGRPVMAKTLEPAALRRAFRGDVPPTEYIIVGAEELDAIAEAGALHPVEQH